VSPVNPASRRESGRWQLANDERQRRSVVQPGVLEPQGIPWPKDEPRSGFRPAPEDATHFRVESWRTNETQGHKDPGLNYTSPLGLGFPKPDESNEEGRNTGRLPPHAGGMGNETTGDCIQIPSPRQVREKCSCFRKTFASSAKVVQDAEERANELL
jgi:hypothetical protein